MRNRHTASCATMLCMCAALVCSASENKAKLNISVVIDAETLEGKPPAVTAAWLGYASGRALWISSHIKANPSEATTYTRTFEEEVAGRESLADMWAELKAKQSDLLDVYLDQLLRVREAKLMREYVWVNLRGESWKEQPTDLQIERFQEWAAVHLVGHVVETHGDARCEGFGGK